VHSWLKRAGVSVHLGTQAMHVISESDSHRLAIRISDGSMLELPADKILVTVGRAPATSGWGLERMAVDLEGRFVQVDDQCRTSMAGVWAIGDLVGEPMLAHKASAQGEMVADIIAGEKRRFDPAAVPAVCFTDPEIVSVGIGLDEALAGRLGAVVETFPFAANGRALTMEVGETGGFVRIVSRDNDRRILGIQAVGAQVSELSGEFALALELGAVVEDIAGTIHAHPTLSEAVREAALRRLHRA
jgi:dihydrolipoamide dehydrogenase